MSRGSLGVKHLDFQGLKVLYRLRRHLALMSLKLEQLQENGLLDSRDF